MSEGQEHEDRARSEYELHVIHPGTSERHTQQLKNLLAEFLLGGLAGGPHTSSGNLFVKVTIEIVERRTGTIVLSMDQPVENAPGVVELLDADLDRLDAATFAEQWGVDLDA
jgi:hypothetical protein